MLYNLNNMKFIQKGPSLVATCLRPQYDKISTTFNVVLSRIFQNCAGHQKMNGFSTMQRNIFQFNVIDIHCKTKKNIFQKCCFHRKQHGANLQNNFQSTSILIFPIPTLTCQHYHHCTSKLTTSLSNAVNVIDHKLRLSSTFSSGSRDETLGLVQEILEHTEKVDVMAGSIPQSQVENLIEELQKLDFGLGPIKTLLSGKLWLLRQPEETIGLCRLLLDHGLSKELVCQSVHCIPLTHQSDFGLVLDKVNYNLMFFRSFGFSENEIFYILIRDASVLYMDETSIRQSIEKVKLYFPSNLTKAVICMSPNVLYDDWSLTQTKFDYIFFVMGYIQSDMIRTRAFSHSLHHIQDRHLFLQRSGLFQFVNKKLHPSLNPNPPLKTVVDTPDETFVKLVDGVTVQDYEVFKRMRELERENEGFDDDGDDDEEEEKSTFETCDEKEDLKLNYGKTNKK